MNIGNRIKQLRVKRGLTLEELASRSELSKGFLSQLERNLTSPSITTLEDITEVLGISLADFFKEDTDERKTFKESDYYVDEKEGVKITWLVPMAQKNRMEPILCELVGGTKTFAVTPHEGEEFGYVLSGKIEICDTTNNAYYTVRKGETFYLTGNDEYHIENNATSVAIFIWVCTPPIF